MFPDAEISGSHGRRLLLGVAAISSLQLGLELLFIKLSHYEFGVLSLGVVGLAMLGVSLGAPLARVLGGPAQAAERALIVLPLSALLAGLVLFRQEHRLTDGSSTALRLAATGAVCLLPLGLSTVPVYVELNRPDGAVHRTYAASLVGGALGVPFTLGLVHELGDLRAYVVLLGAIFWPIWLLVSRPSSRHIAWTATLLATGVAATLLPRADRKAHPASIYTESDAVSRIDVEHSSNGSLWFHTAGINAGCGTASDEDLLSALTALPFGIRVDRTLILGSGAGKDIVQALSAGAQKVVAVEINPMIPRYMGHALPLARDPYRDRRVTLITGEGREVAAGFAAARKRGDPGFDLVYVPLATLYGGSGQSFVETYLMTREAFATYMDELDDGGVVAVRFLNSARAKVLRAMAHALVEHDGRPAAERMVGFSSGGMFVAFARPSRPFSPMERSRLQKLGASAALNIPGELARGEREISLEDDNPFLYNDLPKLNGKQRLFGFTTTFLRGLLILWLASLALCTLLAVSRTRGRRDNTGLGFASAFAVMGTAYAMVQTGLIQRLTFLLGHPLAGAALALPCTLLATGIGAWASRRWARGRFVLLRGASATLLVACIVAMSCVEPRTLVRPEWPWIVRVVLAGACGTVPFTVMGTFFPLIFDRAAREQPAALDYFWVINGVAAVVGSVLVIYGGLRVGLRVTLLLAAALYALLAVWDILSTSAGSKHRNQVEVAFATLLGAFAGGVALVLGTLSR